MHRFKNILFSPLADRNNAAAVRRVTELVEGNGARLTFIGAVPEPTRLQRLFQRTGVVDDVVAAERARLERVLLRLAKRDPDALEVEVGDATTKIVERVLANSHDLVVVTSDEDRHDQTTIRRLLRKCPCPVWVIRPTRARTQRVLACVNPDPSEFELNKTILELASSMIQLNGGELHVVHAWELFGEGTMRNSAFLHTPAAEVDALVAAERLRSDEALTDLVTAVLNDPKSVELHLLKGAAEDTVPELAARKRINLVVIGTAGRTGAAGMIIGNTAERIIDAVGCSLIAVKPPGFTSPIDAVVTP